MTEMRPYSSSTMRFKSDDCLKLPFQQTDIKFLKPQQVKMDWQKQPLITPF